MIFLKYSKSLSFDMQQYDINGLSSLKSVILNHYSSNEEYNQGEKTIRM